MSQEIFYRSTSVQHDGDVKGKRGLVDEYLVLKPSSTIVHTGMDLEGPFGSTLHLPGTGESHPFSALPQFAGLTVDRLAVEPISALSCKVTAYYSNDSRWVPPDTVDETDIDYDAYGADWVLATVQVPFLTLGYYDTGDALIAAWDGNVWELTEPRLVRERGVNLTSLSNVTLDIISEQVGKVHSFDGNLWQFEASPAQQIGNSVWRITYRWIRDKGTARPTNMVDDNGTKFPGSFELPYVDAPGAGLLRDPFHILRVQRGEDIKAGSGTYAAQVLQIPTADLSDPNGWQSLPGLT